MSRHFSLALALIVFPAWSSAQVKEIGEANVPPTPDIKRLFEALAGDWDTSEKRERTQFFPNGGERKGRSHVRLAADGAMLVMEGHSDGSAGTAELHHRGLVGQGRKSLSVLYLF
jgi:hypothetical protein